MNRTAEDVTDTYKLRFGQEGEAATSDLSISVGRKIRSFRLLWAVRASIETESFTLDQEEDVTISIKGEIAYGYWGRFDNMVVLNESGKNIDGEELRNEMFLRLCHGIVAELLRAIAGQSRRYG